MAELRGWDRTHSPALLRTAGSTPLRSTDVSPPIGSDSSSLIPLQQRSFGSVISNWSSSYRIPRSTRHEGHVEPVAHGSSGRPETTRSVHAAGPVGPGNAVVGVVEHLKRPVDVWGHYFRVHRQHERSDVGSHNACDSRY